MKPYTLKARAGFYAQAFPKFPAPRTDERWLDSMWIIGQDYRNGSPFYGAYPHGYLKRMNAMFPDAERALHLFSGSLPPGNYVRFDLEQPADVKGDAHKLAEYFIGIKFDLIFADPAYSVEDSEHYGTPMVNRNKVVKQCAEVLEKDGYLVWLDQTLPMFSKKDFHLCGLIGIVRSTNHRFRVASIFKKT